MKKRYEAPSLTKLQTGLMNKFGNSPLYSRKIRTEIDGVPIQKLIQDHGSPLYVFSERTLRHRFREFQKSLATSYPNIGLGWSYKTNYLQAICAIFHQEGAIAEVVSSFEYEKARKLGIPGNQIIFNGPHKSMAALEKAAAENAIIHVDHFDEIYDLEQISQRLNRVIPIGIRLNMDVGIQPQWSRFGFNLESGQAMEAVKRIVAGKRLQITGLHVHIGTFVLEPAAYARAVEKIVQFGYEIESHFSFKMEYFDLGGGLPSQSKLKGIYLSPDLAVPALDHYIREITEALFRSLRTGDVPKLYLESGRAMVDEAGSLITTVHASKRLPDGRHAYVVDAGVNLLFTAFWYKFNIEMDRECQGMNEPSVIYGPLCMNIDAVEEATLLPPLERGTRLIISPVGAYNQTQSMQFIEYRPATVLVTESGDVELIREAEDLTDIERREKLPMRLRPVSAGS